MSNDTVTQKTWTHQEEQYLIDNQDKPLAEVAEHLGRKVDSIKYKRQKLGLKRPKIDDLTGQRFTRWTVIRENGRKNRKAAWLCKCDCGAERTVSSTHLRNLSSKSCGCLSRDRASEGNSIDLTGRTYGLLTVIQQNGRNNTNSFQWLCQCNCGNQKTIAGNNLVSGNTKSCGCKRALNIQQGLAWENLVHKYLKYRFENFYYHHRLPNAKVPDFMTADKTIIIDAKRNDFLMISECIEKYSPYCEKIIFVCMQQRRADWKSDFPNSNWIEFWYPDDMLSWIPQNLHQEFLAEVKTINEMVLGDPANRSVLIHEAIIRVETSGQLVRQDTVAKEMGVSKRVFRDYPYLSEVLKEYLQTKKPDANDELNTLVREAAQAQLQSKGKVTQQGVARIILQNNPELCPKSDIQQTLDSLTFEIRSQEKYLSTIKQEEEKYQQYLYNQIEQTIEQMLEQHETVTLMKIYQQNRQFLSRKFVYLEKTRQFVNQILEQNGAPQRIR